MVSISEPFIRRPVGTLAGDRAFSGRRGRLRISPGGFGSQCRLSLDPGVRHASGRRPIGDGGDRGSATGAAARRNRRDRPDHLDQFAGQHQHPAAIRHRPRHRSRRARRPGRDQRLARRSAERLAICANADTFTATSRAESRDRGTRSGFSQGGQARHLQANSLRLKRTRSRIRSDEESGGSRGQRGQSRCRTPPARARSTLASGRGRKSAIGLVTASSPNSRRPGQASPCEREPGPIPRDLSVGPGR